MTGTVRGAARQSGAVPPSSRSPRPPPLPTTRTFIAARAVLVLCIGMMTLATVAAVPTCYWKGGDGDAEDVES